MRVLYITPLYLPWQGGLEILCHQLLLELRDRGHEVAVLTTVDDSEAELGRGEVDGVPVMRALAYFQALSSDPRQLLLAQRRVREFVGDFAPDVTHSHDPGLLLWSYQHGFRGTCPLVTTLHNMVRYQWPGELRGLSALLEQSDWLTGVSRDVLNDALTFAPDQVGRSSVIENGVAPASDAVPVADGPLRLLCLGRLVKQKAFERAVAAFAEVVTRQPDATLVIAGEGPHHEGLLSQVEQLGLTDHVFLRGRVEHDDIGPLLRDCTALVMPSRFEGHPLVALEAGWARRPVVATDVPGLRQTVVDGVTGLIVEVGDSAALASALIRLAEDRGFARQLGEGARRKMEREHALSTCVGAYEELYDRLIAERAT